MRRLRNISIVRGILLIGLSLASESSADPALAPLFRDGVILQRDKPLPIWGWANPGENIRVQFGSDEVFTSASIDGDWKVVLPPQSASADPAELIVAGDATVRVGDVLVGDVWLCSGQSNMEWTVENSQNAPVEIAMADHPTIRHFKVPHRAAVRPQKYTPGEWITCSPDTVGSFSAVAYFFGRDYQKSADVPVGLLNCSWGGTRIESWLSEESLRRDPSYARVAKEWQKRWAEHEVGTENYLQALATWGKAGADEATPDGDKPIPHRIDPRWVPSGLYNAMLAPFIPAALRGVIWYQGEANAATYHEYPSLFTSLIRHWRESFGQRLPFYFVQLANFNRERDKTQRDWAFMREAQAAALALPDTGMAVIIDVGEVENIHPKNKQEVGRRLALIARAKLLGENIEYSGPILSGLSQGPGELRLAFTHANGLRFTKAPGGAFEIAGPDMVFHPADARLEGGLLVLSSPAVLRPTAARYAWHNFPDACLYNGAGLPASPFRTSVED